jgi:membrane-bound ClpP family serine protease
MKQVASVALVIGIISMVIGMLLRILTRETALGLVPSSFLEFSIACFLMNIAISVGVK